jgi:hypothetical protein
VKISKRLAVGTALAIGFGAGMTITWAATSVTYRQQANPGLVNALDSVFANLVGRAVGSAVLTPPPVGDRQPRLVLHINADTQIPVDVVFFRGGMTPPPIGDVPPPTGDTPPPVGDRPCSNVAAFSVSNGAITVQASDRERLTIVSNNNLDALSPGPMCPSVTDSAP